MLGRVINIAYALYVFLYGASIVYRAVYHIALDPWIMQALIGVLIMFVAVGLDRREYERTENK